MEKNIIVTTHGNKKVHVVHNYLTGKERAVAIIVHGLTGSAYESKSRSCSKLFTSEGIATLRINLQSWLPKARKLHHTGLYDQLCDIERVIAWAKRRYRFVFAVGHSLGFPSLIIINPKIDGVIGWDGSGSKVFRRLGKAIRDKKSNRYFVDWGVRHDIGTKLFLECKNFPQRLEPLAGNLSAPLCLVVAGGDTFNMKSNKEYFSYAPSGSEMHVIHGSDHNFTAEGDEEKLIQISLQFCKKIARHNKIKL